MKNLKIHPAARRGLFAAFIAAAFLALQALTFTNQNVNPVMDVVQGEPTRIDLLVMGNSHAFTALDAEELTRTTGLETYMLCSSAQNMPMAYQNLKLTLAHQKPKVVALEVYAVLLDNGETLRSTALNMAESNFDGYRDPLRRAAAALGTVGGENLPETVFQLFRPKEMWTRWNSKIWASGAERAGLNAGFTVRGSIIRTSYSQPQGADLISGKMAEYAAAYAKTDVKKNICTTENAAALRDFLALAQQNGIEVWLFKAPGTMMVGTAVNNLHIIEEIAAEYGDTVTHMDWDVLDTETIGFTERDFYDEGSHLNRSGVAKYDAYFGERMAERFGVSYDPAALLTYAGEEKRQNADGTFTYTMESSRPADTEYRFVLTEGKTVLEEQDFSAENSFTDAVDIDSAKKLALTVTMRCTALGEEREYSFMKQNDSIWK